MALQNGPYVKSENPGRVAWCSCGESKNQPYCDGFHSAQGKGNRPVVVEIAEAKTVAWCGCKRSGNKPFCDGTHAQG